MLLRIGGRMQFIEDGKNQASLTTYAFAGKYSKNCTGSDQNFGEKSMFLNHDRRALPEA
jgi:hypothetical protein